MDVMLYEIKCIIINMWMFTSSGGESEVPGREQCVCVHQEGGGAHQRGG